MAIRFEFQEGTNSARDLEETMTLRQAVDAVLNSYSKHTRRRGKS